MSTILILIIGGSLLWTGSFLMIFGKPSYRTQLRQDRPGDSLALDLGSYTTLSQTGALDDDIGCPDCGSLGGNPTCLACCLEMQADDDGFDNN